MSILVNEDIDLCDYSPAEALLSLTNGEVLKFSFWKNVQSGCLQAVELYIWICLKTNYFRGLKVTNKNQTETLSEIPLSSKDVLSKINESSFQSGTDPIEKPVDMNIEDLQRLYYLNLKNEAA